ncbi:MAG: glycosyltransferase [Desulforhopalus sp.]
MTFFLILSIIALIATVVSATILARGMAKMGILGGDEGGRPAGNPTVSIIVPACNEEETIEKGLLSLLAQDYEKLEIIVVNDRSTDKTANVLEALREQYPQLRIEHIRQLPEGWLGKSNALATGAAMAKGEYLVFTDADVLMEKTVISKSVSYVTRKRLDHLTLIFKNISDGWLLNSMILDAGMALIYLFRPWAAAQAGSAAFVGVGAFNMVKTSAYAAIGGHSSFRMHPVDDMMLGKRIKKAGFRQDCLLAYDYLTVPWYPTLGAMVNGLQKNMFAVVHYRLWMVPVAVAAVVVGTILPVWGLLLGDSAVQLVCLAAVAVRLLVFMKGLRLQGLPARFLPGAFITPYISCYIIVRSALVTVLTDGITWRGQHYPLRELKKSKPLIF